MNQFLKNYRVVMRTVGPVFIGSGKEIGKKEYLFLNRRQVGILDIQLLYAELKRRKKEDAFEKYMLGKGNVSLTQWLESQQIRIGELDQLIRYRLDCGEAMIDKNVDRGTSKLQILECMKDAYGMPYVPGSSLKGMFRTILLGADIMKNQKKYQKQKHNMRQNASANANRMVYLEKDISGVEETAFRTLNRLEKNSQDAVNDILQGLMISDSAPLSPNNLALCQKIDKNPNGDEKSLPILRECIKPDTEIRFTMSVDISICNLTETQLMEAVKTFIIGYYENFVSAFKGMDAPKADYVLCGGGCGFVSKTIIYPMYGKPEGIELTQHVFEKTKVPREHKHNRDKQYGASPHIIKCTRYQGKLLQMGVCQIEKIEAV